MTAPGRAASDTPLDAVDRRLVVATQAGLPLTSTPFRALADQLSMQPEDVMQRLSALQQRGVIRRVAAVPNHYRLGYRANGMTVWDVADECVSDAGRAVGALPFVTHCYSRPRRLPEWPYNLFAMVHARDRDETRALAARIAEVLGDAASAHDILYSTRILKKTGLRLAQP